MQFSRSPIAKNTTCAVIFDNTAEQLRKVGKSLEENRRDSGIGMGDEMTDIMKTCRQLLAHSRTATIYDEGKIHVNILYKFSNVLDTMGSGLSEMGFALRELRESTRKGWMQRTEPEWKWTGLTML